MKKTLTEQYVENLLPEAAENELLDAHFERERLKNAFKSRLRRTRKIQQYRLVGCILVVIIATTGVSYWYLQNTKKLDVPQKVLIPSSEPVAALLQKTITNEGTKVVLSNVLMGESIQIPIPTAAKTAFEKNDFATAAQALSELSPRTGDLWYYLGFCYMHTGEYTKSIDYLGKAMPSGCNPNFKDDIEWWTALLLVKQGSKAAAKTIVEKLPANHYARTNKDVEILLSQINRM
jgi:tetratricopeptide (TPR) repeat protein